MLLRSARRLAPVILVALCVSSCGADPGDYSTEASTEIGPPCVHLDMPYSDRICPDSLSMFRSSDVAAETLVVHTTDGRTIRVALPNRTDAIFLSKSALETFLLRHYDATDATKARELRAYVALNFH